MIIAFLTLLFFIVKHIIKNKLIDVKVEFNKLNSIENNIVSISLKTTINNKTPYNFTIKKVNANIYYDNIMVCTANFGTIQAKHKTETVVYKDINIILNNTTDKLVIDKITKKLNMSNIQYKASLSFYNFPIYLKGKM